MSSTPTRAAAPPSFPVRQRRGLGRGTIAWLFLLPALVLLAGLPMPLASGTSLLLIITNSLVALEALGHWPAASLPLVLPLLAGGAIGAGLGQWLAPGSMTASCGAVSRPC